MVDFAPSDSPQSGVDARIGPQDSVVQAVLDAIQAASVEEVLGGDPVDAQSGIATAPPLYEYVNPDALEALYAHAEDHQGTAKWTTTFEYAGTSVSVTSAGTVTVEPSDGAESDQREHGCPDCEEATVSTNDERFLVGATLQCPKCGNEWDVSY